MFRIITTNGVELGLTEEVIYIRVNERNGCFNRCDKKDAIGVAFKSNPYNLLGHNELPELETVIVSEVDGGDEVYRTEQENAALAQQLAETDEAAIELYEANMALEEANAEQDEAIIEIYEMMGEIING
jgi:hypothetical protein